MHHSYKWIIYFLFPFSFPIHPLLLTMSSFLCQALPFKEIWWCIYAFIKKPLNSNFVWMRKFTTHHSQTQYYINTHTLFFLFLPFFFFFTHTQTFHWEGIWLTYNDNGTKKQWGRHTDTEFVLNSANGISFSLLQRGNYDNVVFAEIITRVRFIRRIRYCRVVGHFFFLQFL